MDSKLNICLLLDSRFEPEMPARPEITEIYGKYLPSFGHKITWISASRETGEDIPEYILNKVKLFTIPLPYDSWLPLQIFKVISFLIKRCKLIVAIFKKENYDIIQVRNDVFGALIALYIKKKYKIPFVFQYSFPKSVYKERKSMLHYFGMFDYFVTKHILRKVDLIFPISKWMEEELIREGMPKSKMMPLPMGVNLELFSQNKDGKKIREKYCLYESQVLIYLGTMDKLRELGIILRAFSIVREYNGNVKLLMVGKENDSFNLKNDSFNLKELASMLRIQNEVIFTGQVPYSDIPDYIAATDVCLCPVPPLPIFKVSSPTKMFEYMAMGKPVVANEEIPEHKEVIELSGGGILVNFSSEAFANAIIELLNNPEKAAKMGQNGREWVAKNRPYELLARQVEKRYFELVSNFILKEG